VTVYRTLEILARLGLVCKVHVAAGCHSYVLAGRGHVHHIVCSSCRRVATFDGCDLEAFVSEVGRRTGYTVQSHWLELVGLCPACACREGSDEHV